MNSQARSQLGTALKIIHENVKIIPTIKITIHDVETKEIPICIETIDDMLLFFNTIKGYNCNNN